MPKKSKMPAPVSANQTASEALATILLHNLDYLVQWEETARSWDDIEGVHQMRVSFRRMRSALSLFRKMVPKEVSSHWSEEMRWLANQMGLARDLDVFIDEGLSEVTNKLPLTGQEKLYAVAKVHQARAYQEIVRPMLDSERYAQFKTGFGDWIKNREWEKSLVRKKQRKRIDMNLIPFSRKLMDKQERQVLTSGSHINQESQKEMHQLRIECKKLRYAAEFFHPLFQGMGDFIRHMKGLQDLLGLMNDVAVMQQLLDILLADITDPEIQVYAGGLVGWRTSHYHHMLERFEQYWEELIEAKHPWWKKSALIMPDSA